MNSPHIVARSASLALASFESTRLPDIELYLQETVSTGMSELPEDVAWGSLVDKLSEQSPNISRRDLILAVFAVYAARVSEGTEAIFPLGVVGADKTAYAFTSCSVALAPEDLFEDVLETIQGLASASINHAHTEENIGSASEPSYVVTTGQVIDEHIKAPIRLHISDDGAIRLWHADTTKAEAASLIRERITALAQAIIMDDSVPLIRQPIMSERERELVVQTWNDTEKTHPFGGGLVAMFEQAVLETPDHPALIYMDVVLSFAEFNRRVNLLARRLKSKGVQKDQFVCLCMDRSVELVIAIWATLKAGGAYVPLNVEDPASRIAEIVNDCQPRVLLTQEHVLSRLETQSADVIVVPEGGDIDPTGDDSNLDVEIGESDLAYMIYTSGSTGKPKGVVVEHAAIHNRVVWMHEEYGLGPEDRVLQKTPYTFDVSVWEFLWSFSVGSTLVVAEPGGHTAISYLYSLVNREGVTHLHFVPSVLRLFLMAPALDRLPIKKLFCSGEALGADLVTSFYAKANDVAEVHNLYGPTEAAVDVSYFACTRGSNGHNIPIGRPVDNTGLYVLDEFDQPVPVGVPGELHIGGVQLARGYWAREELTAEKFIPCPVADAPHDRLYRTGDLAFFRPDGQIMYLGRNDFQVKLNGVRIELGEIEAAIRDQNGVSDVVVVPEEENGSKRLIAYVVAVTPSLDAAERLKDGVAASRPIHYVPQEIRFISEMPLTTSGKINRKALAEQVILGSGA